MAIAASGAQDDAAVASLAKTSFSVRLRYPAGAATSAAIAPMAAAWDTKWPHVILKFENAALCTTALAKFNAPKRQRVKWAVQAVDAVRLKLSYEEPKTRHSFRVAVVEPYLGKAACEILGSDEASAKAAGEILGSDETGGSAEGAAAGKDTAPGAGAAAKDAAASVSASGEPPRSGPTHPEPLAGPPLRCSWHALSC